MVKPRFKVGDVVSRNESKDSAFFVVDKAIIVNVLDNMYELKALVYNDETSGQSKLGYEHVWFNHNHTMDLHFELDKEYMDRLEMTQDVKEAFNGEG